jgi:hypothetical protein
MYVLSWTVSGRLQIQHEYKQQQYGKHLKKQKAISLRLFILQSEFLKISVDIQTAFAGETRLQRLDKIMETLSNYRIEHVCVGYIGSTSAGNTECSSSFCLYSVVLV